MSAVVVQLRKRVSSSQTWTNQEIAEFYRVSELLGQAGLAVGLDGGVTDEGDVWQVFFREDTGDILAHFAKIDGDYVVASPPTGDVLRGSDLREMIASIMDRQPALMARTQKTKGNIHLHPTMVLSSFIVMIYLLAVESSEAVASDGVAEAMAIAAQAIADEEGAALGDANEQPDSQQSVGQPPFSSSHDDSRAHGNHSHDAEPALSADVQSMVVSVSMGHTPTLSTVAASAAQPVLVKKLESPAYIDRFTSTMTAVVTAAALILGGGNHDEEFGGQNGAELNLADLQPVNAGIDKANSDKEAVVANLDHQDGGISHASTSLSLQDQTAQTAVTVAPVAMADGAVITIKIALPSVVAIDRGSVNTTSVVTTPTVEQGGVALDGFSVVVAAKSQPVQKVQAVQAQPAVAHEGGEAPAASAAAAPATTQAPAKGEPQLAQDAQGTTPATPVNSSQPVKVSVEPIKEGAADQLIELKFQVILSGMDKVTLIPVDLRASPANIDTIKDPVDGGKTGDQKAGDTRTDSGKDTDQKDLDQKDSILQDSDTPDQTDDGDVRIQPVDDSVALIKVSMAHFANSAVPLALGEDSGEDVVIYSGGNITISGFELGVDRLVIEQGGLDTAQFTAYWVGQGILKLDFGMGETITMIGLQIDGLTF